VDTVAVPELDEAEVVRGAVVSGAKAHSSKAQPVARTPAKRQDSGVARRPSRRPAASRTATGRGRGRPPTSAGLPDPAPQPLPSGHCEQPVTGPPPYRRWYLKALRFLSGVGRHLKTALGWLEPTAWVSLACHELATTRGEHAGLFGHLAFQPTRLPPSGGSTRSFSLARRFPCQPIKQRPLSWLVFDSPPRPPRAVLPTWPRAILPPSPLKPVKAMRMVPAYLPGRPSLPSAVLSPAGLGRTPGFSEAPALGAHSTTSLSPLLGRKVLPLSPPFPVGAYLWARLARVIRAMGWTFTTPRPLQKVRV
jgi:hypothetical protein